MISPKPEDPSPLDLLTSKRTIQLLLIPTVLLPIGMVFLFGFGRFFVLFGDKISAIVVDSVAFGLGFFWFLGLISLVLCLAFSVTKD